MVSVRGLNMQAVAVFLLGGMAKSNELIQLIWNPTKHLSKTVKLYSFTLVLQLIQKA